LAQGLVFGQSEEKKLELGQPFLWKADDPRIANPINRFHFKNPLAPANRFHLENDFNPINRYRLDNPLNPINKYRIDNLLNITGVPRINHPPPKALPVVDVEKMDGQ